MFLLIKLSMEHKSTSIGGSRNAITLKQIAIFYQPKENNQFSKFAMKNIYTIKLNYKNVL